MSIVSRPPTDDLTKFLESHTIPQAAEHYGVHPRTIHKWRVRSVPVDAPQLPQDAPNTQSPPPAYATVAASEIADGDCMWKCPHCGELQHPLPGTTGEQWREQGCYLCSTRHNTPGQDAQPAEAPVPDDELMSTPVVELSGTDDITNADDASAPCVPVPESAPVPMLVSLMPVPPRVVTRVIRVPVEPVPSAAIVWVRGHVPPVQVVVAVLIALALIGIAGLG